MMKVNTRKSVSRRELRQFGLGLGLLLGMVGGILFWKGHAVGPLMILVGLFMALAFWFDLPGVRTFYVGWMRMGLLLSHVMINVMLILLYVLVLVPISWLARLFGQTFLDKGFGHEQSSYWLPRKQELDDPKCCEKQF